MYNYIYGKKNNGGWKKEEDPLTQDQEKTGDKAANAGRKSQ